MSATGKTIRMKRLIQEETHTSVIFAIDHGMTSPTLLRGIVDTETRVRQAISGGANVIMMGRGFAKMCAPAFLRETSLALMLSASAAGRPGGPIVTPIGSVDEALRIGADAVVVYVALGGDNEPDMINYASKVGEACEALGMPFIAEAEYPNAYQTAYGLNGSGHGAEYLKRNARLCAELGADIVKVNWTGSTESFAEITEATKVPVVVAGGVLTSDEELLVRMEQAREAGAIGCSVGRNIFEHPDPEGMTRAICMIWREGKTAQEALDWLKRRTAS